jgi:hypothetical protein
VVILQPRGVSRDTPADSARAFGNRGARNELNRILRETRAGRGRMGLGRPLRCTGFDPKGPRLIVRHPGVDRSEGAARRVLVSNDILSFWVMRRSLWVCGAEWGAVAGPLYLLWRIAAPPT